VDAKYVPISTCGGNRSQTNSRKQAKFRNINDRRLDEALSELLIAGGSLTQGL
jgi:hypothetical protein